jgi:hypothetical protein
MHKILYGTTAALLFAGACSNVGEPPTNGNGRDPSYFPNGDGSSWTYEYQRYLNNVPCGEPFDYTETFDGEAVVGGRVAQRLVRAEAGRQGYEVLYLEDDDENHVAKLGHEYYVGPLMVDAVYLEPPWSYLVYPLRVNRSWSEAKQDRLSPLCLGLPGDVDNDGKDDTVDVEIIRTVVTREDVSLPMGTFEDSYKIRRTIYATFHMTQGGDVEATYVQYGWFKANKGFVQYAGDEVGVPNAARYTFLAQLESYNVLEPSG